MVDAEVVEEGGRASEGDEAAAEVETDLDALLAERDRERDEYLALAQRARADFENYRRRAGARGGRGRAARAGDARARHAAGARQPRAGAAAAGVDPAGRPDPAGERRARRSRPDALAEGVALVYGELGGALERAGVDAFDPVGERFDPTLHEAISTGEAGASEPGPCSRRSSAATASTRR